MSKINNLRFINVNYNNNNMIIDDEIFYLGGKNTLLNLRNGGGKSVLVQMTMAPFMGKRNRSIGDRSFDTYFTTTNPTYILIEWLLDDNAGYLLTGMMVRKRQIASDEDSKDKLEIINFIHEYKSKNKYDIKSFPFIEIQDSKRKLKTFTSSKNLFEELKKNDKYKFNYYDMNTQGKRYFDKLREYKIDNKEWENIIRKINLKESGLSELFNSAKNESGLLKEWFIPAIEDKLNKDEDRIKKYNELIYSYIKQYKVNKDKFDIKKNIESFIELSKGIEDKANDYKSSLDYKEDIENNIANLIRKLEDEYKINEERLELLDLKEVNLKEALDRLVHEEISREIYLKEDEKHEKDKLLNEKIEYLRNEEEKLSLLKRKKKILDCAKLYIDYTEASQETQGIENEIQALNKTNDEKKPRINDLGYSIRQILDEEEKHNGEDLSSYEYDKENLEKEEENLEKSIKFLNNDLNALNLKVAALEERIKIYNEQEEKYNKSYKFNISRNIEGYYKEEDLLSFEEAIKKEIDKNSKELKGNTQKIIDTEDNTKTLENEKEIILIKENEVSINLKNNKVLVQSLEEKINKRKDIIKLIDFSENKLFNTKEILEAFNKKIDELKIHEKSNSKKLEELNKTLERLESGKILELPTEIERAFNKKGINIVYGMQWLKNNGYSEEKNKTLVEKNTFIPYSLIMDDKDIEVLKNESLEVFTNFPIPIIRRKSLEEEIKANNSLIDIENISFYIDFNIGLLDVVQLKELINNLEIKIENINKTINNIQEEMNLYTKKKNEIEYSNLDENEYIKLKEKITLDEEDQKNILSKKNEIQEGLINLKLIKEKLDKEINTLKKESEVLNSKYNDFINLKEEYNKYVDNKREVEASKELIDEKIYNIEKEEKTLKDIKISITDKISVIQNLKSIIKEIKNEKISYEEYKEGNKIIKDKEDLVSEFKALIKNISENEKNLKERLNIVKQRYSKIENELIEKSKHYKINDNEYMNETYSFEKEQELDNNEKHKEIKTKEISKEISQLEGDIKVLNNNIKLLYTDLKEKLNEEAPLNKNEVFERDFELEKAKIANETKRLKEDKNIVIKNIRILERNKSSLASYSNLKIDKEVDIQIDFKTLDEDRGKLERDLRNIKDEIDKKSRNLTSKINDIENIEEFREVNMFKDPLNTMKKLVDNPLDFLEYLNMLIQSYNVQLQKLNTDIELIGEEEKNLLISILEYIEDIHNNIKMIDENSSIYIDGKRRKMLEIIADDFDENKELYKIRIKDYIESIRDSGLKILEENKNIEEFISKNITTIKLYDEVVKIDSIIIKLYKVEENKQIKISWSEVAKNSGGEGFLSAFVILSSLLSYTRKDESDIFSNNEGGKVLIMDNPFAQTNAVHLLKPLVDIAKKSNTQLICLSGLGGDSIYGRFENIYVLNLIKSSLNINKSYLKGEHKKGSEDAQRESLIAARFDIEEVDQVRLF